MAHEIEATDIVAVREKQAWHGLAKVFEGSPTFRELCDRYGIEEVQKMPVCLPGCDNPIDNLNVVTTESGRVIPGSACTDDYSLVKVAQIEAIVARIAEHPGLGSVETIGTLNNGADFFVSVQIDGDYRFGDDENRPYLTITDSRIGRRRLEAGMSLFRVVCSNTMHGFIRDSKGRENRHVSLKHTSGMADRMFEIDKLCGMAVESARLEAERIKAMTERKLTSEERKALLSTAFPTVDIPKNASERQAKNRQTRNDNAEAQRSEAIAIAQAEADIVGLDPDSLWMIFNGATNIIQHEGTVHGEDPDKDNYNPFARDASIRHGNLANRTNAVHDKALELLNA